MPGYGEVAGIAELFDCATSNPKSREIVEFEFTAKTTRVRTNNSPEPI